MLFAVIRIDRLGEQESRVQLLDPILERLSGVLVPHRPPDVPKSLLPTLLPMSVANDAKTPPSAAVARSSARERTQFPATTTFPTLISVLHLVNLNSRLSLTGKHITLFQAGGFQSARIASHQFAQIIPRIFRWV